ncbi:hypothetical protein FHR99_000431 [Litorivivens lipolytica]|uniref:Uncharacterized protein n=1 Tax=Litorivivens lipolytica TaxID=1524264 RepID=A0A7W4W2D9_9GAMM|nr:hypothetical protein [Litorivivens lipolytica]
MEMCLLRGVKKQRRLLLEARLEPYCGRIGQQGDIFMEKPEQGKPCVNINGQSVNINRGESYEFGFSG